MYAPGEIEEQLRQGSPWQVFLVGDVASTMDEARRLAAERPQENFLVAVAETQSAGLGRYTRRWVSSADGLWMTALLRPSLPARNAAQYTLAAAVAVAEALLELGFPVGIKWPNDVLATDENHFRRKLCGIRCEMELAGQNLAWLSLGIGINVNHTAFSEELSNKAASLCQINGGQELSRSLVAAAVLNKLEETYVSMEQEGFALMRKRWLALAFGVGEEACVQDRGGTTSGIVRGLDEDGHLLLELSSQEALHTVLAGDLVFEVTP